MIVNNYERAESMAKVFARHYLPSKFINSCLNCPLSNWFISINANGENVDTKAHCSKMNVISFHKTYPLQKKDLTEYLITEEKKESVLICSSNPSFKADFAGFNSEISERIGGIEQ